MERDLTRGSIPGHILHMSVPTMSGLLFQGFYDLVDMVWIGQISYAAVAGVTIFISIFWVFEVVNEIIGMSSVSLISQSHGAGDRERTRRAAEQTIMLKFLVSAGASLLMLLTLRPLVGLFTSDGGVTALALEYGYVRALFMPVFFSSFSVNTIFRCTGDARTPMFLLSGSAAVNILLDPILMFDTIPFTSIPGFGLGMRGAAAATVIAYSLAFAAGFILLLKGKGPIRISLRGIFTFDRELDRKLLTIGLPSGVEMLFRNAANSIMIILVGTYGTAAVALIGVGTKLQSFIFMPILGLLMGSGTIAGQNIGAEEIGRAGETARYSALIGALITLVFVTVMVIFPRPILRFFLSDLQNLEEGVRMLRIVLPSLVLAAVSLGFAAVFSGSGYMVPFLVSCIVGKWVVMLPYVFVVTALLSLPLDAVWLSFIIGEAVELVVITGSFAKGTWKGKRV